MILKIEDYNEKDIEKFWSNVNIEDEDTC